MDDGVLVGSLEAGGITGPLLVAAMLRGYPRAAFRHRFAEVEGTVWAAIARKIGGASNGDAPSRLIQAVAGVRLTGYDPESSRRTILGEIARLDGFLDGWLELDSEFERRGKLPIRTAEEAAGLLRGVHWFWRGWMPAGLVSLLVGRPGDGKSYIAAWIASNWLKRWILPDGATGEPTADETSTVMWIDTENAHDLLIDRLAVMGADRKRFFWPLDPKRPGEDFPMVDFSKQEWIGVVTDQALHRRPGLIVVDSLRGAHMLDENSSDIQAMISACGAIARDVDCALLFVHHLRKARPDERRGDEITIDQVRGSSAIVAAARVVFALDKPNLSQPEFMRLHVIKSFTKAPEAIGVQITDLGPKRLNEVPARPRPARVKDKAVDFLREQLANGPVTITELRNRAESEMLSQEALRQGKVALGLVAIRIDHQWAWSLPSVRDDEPTPADKRGSWLD